MVQMVDPDLGDTIYDPACGTAGFLIDVVDHILARYSETPQEVPIYGEDWLEKRGQTLEEATKEIPNLQTYRKGPGERIPDWARLEASVYGTDVSRQMMRSLAPGGRCAVVVPEGALFGSTRAHQELREKLLREFELLAVVSLPAGVFKPYAGVKTSVLVFRRPANPPEQTTPVTARVWFYEIRNDGFDPDKIQGGGRPETPEKNDFHGLLAAWAEYRASRFESPPGVEAGTVLADGSEEPCYWWVTFETIVKTGFNLAGSRYKPQVAEPVPADDPEDLIRGALELEQGIVDGLRKLFVSQHVALIRPKSNELNPDYLASYANLPLGEVPVLARFQYGQTKPGLGFRELLTSKIPVPPISLQRAFAGHVESLRDLGRRRRRARGRLRVLWQSVLTSAFSGNLTQRWRETHMNELLREMDQQAMTLGEIR